jgi:aspartokinase/homoserine dehydrogenase 1
MLNLVMHNLRTTFKKKCNCFFKQNTENTVNVITGFIGSTTNDATTLGRNGSNYTASLIANYLNADELQNYTHVDGIYTANQI